jgi:hypothetical protein
MGRESAQYSDVRTYDSAGCGDGDEDGGGVRHTCLDSRYDAEGSIGLNWIELDWGVD